MAAKPGQTPSDDCRLDTGWPSQKVLQLLLAFSGSTGNDTADILLLGGGDAEARGNTPWLPAAVLLGMEIVDAPSR